MRPMLPSASQIHKYIKRIDASRTYTNFGPLSEEFLAQLLRHQAIVDGDDQELHGVLTNSGTSALELSLEALALPKGCYVAVPALTFPATATAVIRCGLRPYAVDIDEDTWLMTPDSLERSAPDITFSAVIPVATFGVPQDTLQWRTWSLETGIPVIIDAAAAFDAQRSCEGVTVVFSLHATKILSSAEGGLVLTKDSTLATRIKYLSNFGIGLHDGFVGTNAKLSEYHAAIGLAHLEILPIQKAARIAAAKTYEDCFSKFGLSKIRRQMTNGLTIPSVMVIHLGTKGRRDDLEHACNLALIQTRRWYQPLLPMQSMLKRSCEFGVIPVAESIAEGMIGLPFFPDISKEQIEYVVKAVSDCYH